MTYEEFEPQMAKLIDVFGAKNYSGARLEGLWDLVKDCSARSFERWVHGCITGSKQPPIGPQFREFAIGQEKVVRAARHLTLITGMVQGKMCLYCGDEGLVLAIKKSDGVQWAFVCSFCQLADNNPGIRKASTDENNHDLIGTWDDRLRDQYELVPLLTHLTGAKNKKDLKVIKNESVFSRSEINEMFTVMRQAAAGLITKEHASQYADCVRQKLEANGIKAQA